MRHSSIAVTLILIFAVVVTIDSFHEVSGHSVHVPCHCHAA